VTLFSNFKQNKQFSKEKKILRISKDFIEIFQIFTQFLRETFDFVKSICEIKNLLTFKLREKKKLHKSIVRLTGEWKKSNFGKFWKILVIF
jgi:hypothetical protein